MQLKQKILKLHKKNFKEKLGKLDRIKCDPVQLKIDTSREIKPKKNTHCYDIPLHLKEAAREEFNEMLNSGIVVPADDEPTEWASLAFPRRKPNSYPAKCRWVADFRDLNRALDRPVWGVLQPNTLRFLTLCQGSTRSRYILKAANYSTSPPKWVIIVILF